MKKCFLEEMDILAFESENKIVYGGYQDMYPTMWQRKAGCGPTCTSNLFTYMAQTNKNVKDLYCYFSIDHDNVLHHMEEVWQFVTPKRGGLNRIEYLADGGVNFSRSKNVSITPNLLHVPAKGQKPCVAEATNFLINSLESGSPVAFLNLDNGGVKDLYQWHWVLIMGVEYDDNTIIGHIFDEGDKIIVNISQWIERTKRRGGFVSFQV